MPTHRRTNRPATARCSEHPSCNTGHFNKNWTHVAVSWTNHGSQTGEYGSQHELYINGENVNSQTIEPGSAFAQVSGWGVYCYNFLLLPIASSVSYSCLDALNTLRDIKFRRLLRSPTVSQCLRPV